MFSNQKLIFHTHAPHTDTISQHTLFALRPSGHETVPTPPLKSRGGGECVRLARSFAVLGDGVYFMYTGKPETAKNVTR